MRLTLAVGCSLLIGFFFSLSSFAEPGAPNPQRPGNESDPRKLATPEPSLRLAASESRGLASFRVATYVLSPNDLVQVKVYRQEDLDSKVRLAQDGTTTFPLLGTVSLAGKTVEEAAAHIRDLLEKDYLVNPQVTVTVLEYAKRRFSVLGQVQKPGAYEIPSEESVNLLEAIAMAGGFTRLANTSKISVTRVVNGKKTNFTVDAKEMTKDDFVIRPDDTITVSQRIL